MLKRLENYYLKYGILSTSFTCEHKSECKGNCKSFTGPKSAYVGKKYGRHNTPRLVFLSLDSGKGSRRSKDRLPQAVRSTVESHDIKSLPKNRHWYRTHELALYILKHYVDGLEIENSNHYFAHVNSAKCSMNKARAKEADKILFKNCQNYLGGELKVLKPNIVVTQGKKAADSFKSLVTRRRSRGSLCSVVLLNSAVVFWVELSHPANYGMFNKQREADHEGNPKGWEKVSRKILKFQRSH